MKFSSILYILLILLIWFGGTAIFIAGENIEPVVGILILFFIILVILIKIAHHFENKKLPGGTKGAKVQGIWVLEKHLNFNPEFRKWEEIPVEPKKNYFEFKGSDFRSGDFDSRHKQLPAEFSPFSIEGENMVFKMESLSKVNWKWAVKGGSLELTGEMLHPEGSKAQFIFYKKNWA